MYYWEVEFEIGNEEEAGADMAHVIYVSGNVYLKAESIMEAIDLAISHVARIGITGKTVITGCKQVSSTYMRSASKPKGEKLDSAWEAF